MKAKVCTLKSGLSENEKPCNMNFNEIDCLASSGSNCDWDDETYTPDLRTDDNEKPSPGDTCNEQPTT